MGPAKDIDVVIPMYDLTEYNDNYLKTSRNLWQHYRDEPFINDNEVIIDVPGDPDSASFKSRPKTIGQTGNGGTKDVQITIPLKYLSSFWRTLEMSLITFEINIFLTWSEKCIILTDTKRYVPVVTLSAQDNAKLLEPLGFKSKQVLKEQLTGININQKQHYRHETNI